MATTHTDDHGLVAIFEPVDCTLYNFVHEQGERVSVQGIAKCAGNLAGALKHAHMRGYVHGAISSHCVFLATCGSVKLGGWELAHSLPGVSTSHIVIANSSNSILNSMPRYFVAYLFEARSTFVLIFIFLYVRKGEIFFRLI